ncbi:MAG: hypothetical protein ACE5L7_05100 [Candidatus Aminicenantales bacterium]
MKNHEHIHLNLATHPSRNRRLFYFLNGTLVVLFVTLSIFGEIVFSRYSNKSREIDESVSRRDRSIRELEKKHSQNTVRIDKITKDYEESVDVINSLIYKKSFSWVGFLSCLESSLPASSYIISLAPTLTEDLEVKMRFAVVSQSLEDLLKFINNLRGMKFNDIRVMNEVRNEQGLLRSEISLTYERNI